MAVEVTRDPEVEDQPVPIGDSFTVTQRVHSTIDGDRATFTYTADGVRVRGSPVPETLGTNDRTVRHELVLELRAGTPKPVALEIDETILSEDGEVTTCNFVVQIA